jgi:hypothetical protein
MSGNCFKKLIANEHPCWLASKNGAVWRLAFGCGFSGHCLGSNQRVAVTPLHADAALCNVTLQLPIQSTMVGVAGKSRACHDCKRRRVKVNMFLPLRDSTDAKVQCDFQRPSCLRCEKAQLSCQGYYKTSVFVNRTLAKPSTTVLAAISATKQHGTKKMCKSTSISLQRFQQLQSSISDLSCSPISFRTQAWEILKTLYLPNAQFSTEIYLATTTPYSWVPVVCEMTQESSVLDQALLVFCAIQINIAEPGSTPALQLYSEALSKLAQNLGYAHEQGKDETLAAIVVLSTCEVGRLDELARCTY